jgi:hypothetical protein
MPPEYAGLSASVTSSSNQRLPGAQVRSSKQPPPPSKKITSRFGSATRVQKAYRPPRAHLVAPPGSTRFHAWPPAPAASPPQAPPTAAASATAAAAVRATVLARRLTESGDASQSTCQS